MTRQYRIYVSTVAAGDALASIRIVQKGQITAIEWDIAFVTGAGVDFYKQFELSKQSSNSLLVNDVPANVLANFNIAGPVASVANNANKLIAGLQNPVEAGDFIYIHSLQSGTAPGTCRVWVGITVSN